MKIKYNFPHFDPDKLDPQNINRMVIEKVPEKSDVLDIGCATGFMGEFLIKKKNCRVTGVEMRFEEIKMAKGKLTKILKGNVEETETIRELIRFRKGAKFDVILAISIIEHLVKPNIFLAKIKRLLKPGGLIIMTTPNIAHWTIRASLMMGKFDYKEYGILDETHLHFYTIESFRKLLSSSSYKVISIAFDTVGGGYPRISRLLGKFLPGIFAYQILIVASI